MNAKSNGQLQGFIGRLGDLGMVNREFDVAFSSASNLFDYFVVKNVQNAQGLLDFVRRNQLGKAYCIILDKISEPPEGKFNLPCSKCSRLFDLIKFLVPEARKAFYLALKDTLVAENLEDCRKIAFGSSERWRVVCITGEIFNQSGEMIGHSRPVSGKIKLSDSSNPVHQGQSKDSILQEIRSLTEYRSTEESYLESLESDLSNLTFSKSSLEKDLKKLKSEEALLIQNLESSKIRFDILIKRKSEHFEVPSSELIHSKEATLEKLSKFLNLKKEDLLKIETKIENQASRKYSELKQNLEILERKEEKLENELVKNEQKQIQQGIDLQKSEEKLKKLEEIIKNHFNLKEKLLEEKDQNQKAMIEKAGHFNQLESILEEKKEEINLFHKEKQRVDLKIAKIHQDLNKGLERKQTLDKELESLRDQSLALNEQIKKNREKFTEDIFPFLNDPVLQLESSEPTSSLIDEALQDPYSDYTQSQISKLSISLSAIDEQEQIIQESLETIQKDISILEKFKKKIQDFEKKSKKLAELKNIEQEKKNLLLSLKNERLSMFNKGFSEISKCLKEIYRLITAGGDADLEFSDSTDPFSEGVVFTVRPPSKAWKKMTNLSGGEKTLSSLALVFALHIFKPNALYVMDEVDAALDFVNVGIVAHYIKKKTRNAQFVVVSLRYQMFELANQLVGIFKVDGVSSTLCISPYVFVGGENKNQIIQQTANNLKTSE
jgi:structural maintenance of chromosome 4